jgi:drug/metabolite transporter (DMT)-like permease
MSTLIWAAEPALILLLAWLLLRERLTRPLLLLSAVALAGAVMVVGAGTGGVLSGNLLVATAVLCCAIYTVWTRHLIAGVEPLVLVTLQQTVSLAWALLIWPMELWQMDWVPSNGHSLPSGFWRWLPALFIMAWPSGFTSPASKRPRPAWPASS